MDRIGANIKICSREPWSGPPRMCVTRLGTAALKLLSRMTRVYCPTGNFIASSRPCERR